MAGQLGERGRKVGGIEHAEAREAARAVDEQLIPDAARISVNHAVPGEIEGGRQIGNDPRLRVLSRKIGVTARGCGKLWVSQS